MVGTPAKSSIVGFRTRRVLSEANSLKKMAADKPRGTATSIAMPVVIRVPFISGSIPKLGFEASGANWVLKTSLKGTFSKNL